VDPGHEVGQAGVDAGVARFGTSIAKGHDSDLYPLAAVDVQQ